MDWLGLIPSDAGYVGMLVLGAGPFVVAMLFGRLITKSVSDARLAVAEKRVTDADARALAAEARETLRVNEANGRADGWRELYVGANARADRLAEAVGAGTELGKSVGKLVAVLTGQEEDGPHLKAVNRDERG